MGNIDWNSQPTWLVALVAVMSGLIVPITTAIVGKWRSKPDDPLPHHAEPVEIGSPWMVQNLTEVVLTIRNIKASQDALIAAVNNLAMQINILAARRDKN